jgi:hypothetical protein
MCRASDVIKRFRSYLQQEAKGELDRIEKNGGLEIIAAINPPEF